MVYKYVFEGTLPVNVLTYVKRQADDELYKSLKTRKYCYVLNSRQTGKSSLRVQTMQKLRDDRIACCTLDLSIGDTQYNTPDQWYLDIIDTLVDKFNLDVDSSTWWCERNWLSSVKRLSKFIEEVLLVELTEDIVIFIEEIDSVLSLKFSTDDFFEFIRACYNQRADNPEYNRLTFCLIGVATPSDLIRDQERAPFNIGRAIQLNGFQPHEVEPLAKGLEGKVSNPQAVLEQVLYWTGGQPFLTQKLCKLISELPKAIPIGNEVEGIKQLVKNRVLKDWESQDSPQHLRTIRDRLLTNERRVGRLLGLYEKILLSENKRAGKVLADDSLEQWQLRLSGLVVKQNGELKVSNRIYRNIFNRTWVKKTLVNWQPYAKNLKEWLDSDCKDESPLLRGQVLEDALTWAEKRSLNDQGYKFLMASLKLENQDLQRDLDNQDIRMGLVAVKSDNKNIQQALEAQRQAQRDLKMELLAARDENENIQRELLSARNENKILQDELDKKSRLALNLDNEKNNNKNLVKKVIVLTFINLFLFAGVIILSFMQDAFSPWAIILFVLVAIVMLWNYERIVKALE